VQTFASYHRSGVRLANYHCAALVGSEPSTQVIARVNLGDWRVAILLAGNGYEARWNAGEIWHRINGGPVELGEFMELVLNLGLNSG
jgi:hypothetical protein